MAQEQEFDEVVIVGMARTPFGSFGGALSKLPAVQLGSIAIKGALERAGVEGKDVSQVFMGNVVSAGLGQAPAKLAATGAGIPAEVPCTTINKVCSSGMKSVMIGCLSLLSGESEVVVCGGMESMSNAPFLSQNTRFGNKFGHVQFVDALAKDGLADPHTDEPMGCFAAQGAAEMDISRDEQDDFAAASYERAMKATENGKFKKEIIPVTVKKGKQQVVVDRDEEPFQRPVTRETLRNLPPAFKLPAAKMQELGSSPHANSVTAGTSSVISDGAAAVVMTRLSYARAHNLPILAIVVSWADASLTADRFVAAPPKAMHLAMQRAGIRPDQVDLFEVNEAFSLVPIVAMREFNIPIEKMNIYGGAAALGHPIGASGARLITTMISALENENKTFGTLGICNGGGGASAMVIARPPSSAKL